MIPLSLTTEFFGCDDEVGKEQKKGKAKMPFPFFYQVVQG